MTVATSSLPLARRSLPLVERKLTAGEIIWFQHAFSIFTNGSGSETEKDGTTRIGWRQMERVVAEFFKGKGDEDKSFFDVVAPYKSNKDIGISVKSKTLSKNQFDLLSTTGRTYMELTNSPQLIWDSLRQHHLSRADFKDPKKSGEIGNAVLDTVESWGLQAAAVYPSVFPGRILDLDKSLYLCISMSAPIPCAPKLLKTIPINRRFHIHSYKMQLPRPVKWTKHTELCIRGWDVNGNALYDWYAESGGQLKYYPPTSDAIFASGIINTTIVPPLSLAQNLKMYWPKAVY